MASGSLPVVYNWPGAQSLFAPYVYEDMLEAIPEVIAFADNQQSGVAQEALSDRVARHDFEKFTQAFMQL